MSSVAPSTVYLRYNVKPFIKTAQAAGTITPGEFVQLDTAGKYIRQSLASAVGPKLVALEGGKASQLISEDYVADDEVKVAMAQPGDVFYSFVPAGAAAIVVGDYLALAGDGTLIKAAAGTGADVVAIALEAVDNSGGGTKARIQVETI